MNLLKVLLVYLSIFVFLFSSCITVLSHAPDDGYRTVDKSQLVPFRSEAIGETGTAQFMEVSAADMKKLISDSDKVLVVLWATWCGHCYLEMPAMLEKAKNRNILFVSADYNLERMRKTLTDRGYNKPVYIISSPVYGSDENIKTSAFLKELSANKDSITVFPKHLYFNKGELLTVVPGRMTPEGVEKLFNE